MITKNIFLPTFGDSFLEDHARRKIIPPDFPLPIYCCDSDSLIHLNDAGLLPKMRNLVKSGRIKISEGVYREIHR